MSIQAIPSSFRGKTSLGKQSLLWKPVLLHAAQEELMGPPQDLRKEKPKSKFTSFNSHSLLYFTLLSLK